jgi:hypothetical protein
MMFSGAIPSLLHNKEFAQALNIVILVKTNFKTNARSHVILFSSDQRFLNSKGFQPQFWVINSARLLM